MVFAMLIASKLLIGVQLALKFLTMSHAYLDLFLPNRQQCFQQTCAIETGISDFQKMVVNVMKTHYKKQKTKTIQYRNCKYFHKQSFNFEVKNYLLKIDINNTEFNEFF